MPDWADWTGPNDAAGARAAQSGREKISELPSLARKSEKLRGDVRPALKVLSPFLSLKFLSGKHVSGYGVDELNKCKLLILQDRRISENRSAVSMQLLTSTGFEIESKKVEISFVISTEGAFRTSDDHPIPSVPTCRSFCSE